MHAWLVHICDQRLVERRCRQRHQITRQLAVKQARQLICGATLAKASHASGCWPASVILGSVSGLTCGVPASHGCLDLTSLKSPILV